MNKQYAHYNRKILAGCGLFVLLGLTAVIAFAALLITTDRQAAHYPNAEPISNHENYSGLPFSYKWDNAYRSTDPFPAVYNWYSTGFDLGPEMRANGRCILMEGSQKQLAATRYMSVLLCNTPNGNLIYVSRSTSFR
jgi:hypothetical protein